MGGPFRYAGVENGDACYCGNADDKFIPTDPKECNIPCTGDPGQFCGSSWRLQVYDTEYTDSCGAMFPFGRGSDGSKSVIDYLHSTLNYQTRITDAGKF